uniref:Uncharacterized protein n=1 Tax=Rhizophora mucronata TaxID=61149 RepID=A0A2P2MRT6_RHIMU
MIYAILRKRKIEISQPVNLTNPTHSQIYEKLSWDKIHISVLQEDDDTSFDDTIW